MTRKAAMCAAAVVLLTTGACDDGEPLSPIVPDPDTLASALTELASSEEFDEARAQRLGTVLDDQFERNAAPLDVLRELQTVFEGWLTSDRYARLLDLGRDAGGYSVSGLVPEFRPSCDGGTNNSATVVLFVNGMNNRLEDFHVGLAILRPIVETVFEDGLVSGYYNASATDTEFSEFGSVVCPSIGQLTALTSPTLNLIVEAYCASEGGFVVDLLEAGSQAVREWALYYPATSRDIAGIANLVQALVDAGHRVVLLPHSQGNFFVRDALKSLPYPLDAPEWDAIGVLMTGSPESTNNMPARHVRRLDTCGDRVSRLGNPSGVGCVENTFDGIAGWSGTHSFPLAYCADPPVRARMIVLLGELDAALTAWTPPDVAHGFRFVVDGWHFETDWVEAEFAHSTGTFELIARPTGQEMLVGWALDVGGQVANGVWEYVLGPARPENDVRFFDFDDDRDDGTSIDHDLGAVLGGRVRCFVEGTTVSGTIELSFEDLYTNEIVATECADFRVNGATIREDADGFLSCYVNGTYYAWHHEDISKEFEVAAISNGDILGVGLGRRDLRLTLPDSLQLGSFPTEISGLFPEFEVWILDPLLGVLSIDALEGNVRGSFEGSGLATDNTPVVITDGQFDLPVETP